MAEYYTQSELAILVFNASSMDDAELAEAEDIAYEMYVGIKAQFDSEVALYGDAWPGGAIETSNAYQVYMAYHNEWNQRMRVEGLADADAHVRAWAVHTSPYCQDIPF